MRKLIVAFSLALPLAACGQDDGRAYERARAYYSRNDFRSAGAELNTAVRHDPSNAAAHLLKARVHLRLEDGIAAQAELERARALGVAPDEIQPLIAHALLLQGKPREALAQTRSFATRHAWQNHQMRGRAYGALGQFTEASAEFEKALRLAPKNAELRVDIGRLHLISHKVGEALAAADSALALDGRNLEALLFKGDLSLFQRTPAVALKWFDRALAIAPDDVRALVGKAGAFADLAQPDAANQAIARVQELEPSNPAACLLQAKLAADAKKFDLARSALQMAGASVERNPAALLLSARVESAVGNHEIAIGKLNGLLALQPGNVPARRMLASAQIRIGDATSAAETLRPIADRADADPETLDLMARALKVSDSNAASTYAKRALAPGPAYFAARIVAADRAMREERWQDAIQIYETLQAGEASQAAPILNNLAWAYYKSGRIDVALPRSARAYRLAPGNASIADTYGWILHESRKDRARGLEVMKAALALAPRNPTIRWHVAQAYAANGQAGEARALLLTLLKQPGFADKTAADALLKSL